jgi:electron transfer flavoprotein alpha subunit
MGNVLVWMETAGDKIRGACLPALTFARQAATHHGGEVIVLVTGSGVAAAAQDAARYASRVLVADGAGLKDYLAETTAPVLVRAAQAVGASLVCAGATSSGKDLLPRAAALLDAGMASDVMGVLGPKTFKRPMAAGNALVHLEVTTPVAVASVRLTEFRAASPSATVGDVEPLDVGGVDPKGASVASISGVKSARPELTEARVVISGGRGMREAANFKPLEELADLFGGAMGASRAACDAGMVPNELQVGQTGKVVAPDLYIAVALSGAIQHLAGMKGSKVIVAINKDPEAPIFSVADYGLVAQWEKVLPELIEAVRTAKAAG